MFPASIQLHPIVDHFTIALASVGVACDVAGALASFWRFRLIQNGAERLRRSALILMIGGALAAIVSYFTGDAEANRVWDTMTPAAHTLLYSDTSLLAHATLGRYLMWTFVALAAWRIAQELVPILSRAWAAYLCAALVATGALLYQGKTGGELVYDYGVGIAARVPAGSSAR
ncbi:MAG TPA: DUF2231 domain-containing protein [Candidatus Binataceae bacterium]|nr:DUF2231 domain-containing protein [Candidatus Binataceae bacterium]